jgi:hypothetical protein
MSLFSRVITRLEDGGNFSATHMGITLYQKVDVISASIKINDHGGLCTHLQEWAKRSIHNNAAIISFKVEGDLVKIYY